MKQNNVIISGASGFVGQNLLPFLKTENWNVTPLSRKRENSISLDYNNLTVNDFNSAYAFIHLAGKAHDLKKTSNDEEYYEVNTELTKQLFDLFLESDAKVFIYFSSVKAVADEVNGVLTENHPYEPGTVYGKSKALAEQYLLNKSLPSNKKLYILRPCMIHGPGNKGNLNLLYRVVSKGIPYPLGAFDNKRSFVSINTITHVIDELLKRLPDSGVFNLADDYAISTNDLIRVMALAISKKPKVLAINKSFLRFIAGMGTLLQLPFNKERLQKLTESYEVSNSKIKTVLKINKPFDTKAGLTATIKSFKVTQ
ncbi:NAD-dependent epimerase/dehydratase family protein [Dokdonia donghaensis]|uniref:Dehydratase n=1 Tax=Dokdonia donghaensis DSW-1 TaxID=1300343 RepID=A0A0A2GT63_9FLAO|nr:NAD-dependent epimerase/dehydratase family protein [Dokdonia donghaensis]ANH61077.1 ADP-L-glycero-D-manno-heptose-6-epimerase [Dokdonia donghaensis DSW-1]KGO05703.1 dehydratase [Dokdonia donghaensis DSW-1]